MNQILINLGIVVIFILIGGFFAASELALVSLRESQIDHIDQKNPRQGARLRRLARDPNRFLAAVQVGVTLAGFLSAGFGAAQIAPDLAPTFVAWGLSPGLAETVAFVLVTIVIAYLSLVLGELVPKRMALQRTEGIAARTAGLVDWLARVSRPFIWLLSVSTDALVRLLGGDPAMGRERMTQEELRGLVATHDELTEDERDLIDDVFAAGERELREVMIPRTEVAFLPEDMPLFTAAEKVGNQPHSRYPVIGRNSDDVIGFVHVRDLLDPGLSGRSIRVGALARPVPRMPSTKRVIPTLTELRDSGHHLAIVVDEYGGTDGIVTMEDLVEELVGDIRDEYDAPERPDPPTGAVPVTPQQIDGLLNLDDFAEDFGTELPEGPYETVAGYVVHRLGRLPQVGDAVEWAGIRITVDSLDGRRADRLTVTPVEVSRSPEPQ